MYMYTEKKNTKKKWVLLRQADTVRNINLGEKRRHLIKNCVIKVGLLKRLRATGEWVCRSP